MNREKVFQVLNELDDRYITESMRYAPGEAVGSPERIVPMKKKRIITLALAAALILALSVGAYAVSAAVSGPKDAERVAMQELEVWKKLGLLSPELDLTGTVPDVIEVEEREGGAYWYGRIFHHSYDVRCYPLRAGDSRNAVNLRVDTQSGKIVYATITAYPQPGDSPVDEIVLENEKEPQTFYYYDIFDHIVPADMTVDRFCALLAEYWGFTGYQIDCSVDDRIAGTLTHEEADAILLCSLGDRTGSRYLTVFFEGDQEGAPMYVELCQFPEHVLMNIGTNHAVG